MKVRTYQILLSILLLTSCHDGAKQKNSVSADYQYATLIPDTLPLNEGEGFGRILVDASVYAGLMQMLGVGDRCIDFSDDMTPDVEKIIQARPDLILFSAYDGADFAKYRKLGIPMIECRDFMEPSALGRAEWMRYFGRLWGVQEKSDSLFKVVEQEYQIASVHSTEDMMTGDRNTPLPRKDVPTCFFDMKYGNAWYQPSRESTIGQIVKDAGGSIPFTAKQTGGSLALSEEQVLMEAGNADFWLIRTMDSDAMTLASLAAASPVYSRFKAFRTGHVYVCDTHKTPFYEETPFRPDLLLKEIRKILQGETSGLRYFRKLR